MSDYTRASAEISPCQRYRYKLYREWNDINAQRFRFVMWIGLNPSTADATQDDPTIRRCREFTRAWGFASMVMCNIFAYRATDPRVMKAAADPIGPDNDRTLQWVARSAALVICAWGAHGTHLDRDQRVREILPPSKLHYLRLTKDGHPGHPLYLPAHLDPQPWTSNVD
jgi:hypothetical protein